MKKSTAGFTLLELVVGILCASLITGAAMSLMLMGLRNAQSLTDANTNLQNSRIILTMVEKLASEGIIQKIDFEDVSAGSPDSQYDWMLLDKSSEEILRYSHTEQIIYSTNDTVLMEEVTDSTITISDAPLGGSLIDFSITTDEGTFETTVYCRGCEFEATEIIWPDDSDENRVTFLPDTPSIPNDGSSSSIKFDGTITGGRTAFLSTLLTQYGSNGEIIGSPGQYFSKWYNGSWNPARTAWCACFVSWGIDFLHKAGAISPYISSVDVPKFAHVTTGWKTWEESRRFYPDEYVPYPGDLIFFDWNKDFDESNSETILEHIGTVLYVGNGYVYTIEGNSNAQDIADGYVAIQRYRLDSDVIHGYAVLNWKNP